MTRIYIDACALSRPLDEQSHERIRLESEAMLLILNHLHRGHWRWVESDVLLDEIDQIPNILKRTNVTALLTYAHEHVTLDEQIVARGLELEALGFKSYDALHLACAEAASVDVFLTTDDRLQRLAIRHPEKVRVRVANPVSWIMEE